MSRIQEILAKAERDGTARRTHSGLGSAAAVAAPAPAPAPAAVRIPRAAAFDAAFAVSSSAGAPLVDPPVEPRVAPAVAHPALVAALSPHSAAAEQFRAIRTRIGHRDETAPVRTILITSPAAGEGKSIVAANLALAAAQEDQRNVLLLDADLRHPAVHELFGLEPVPGLSEVLSGDASLDDALVYVPEYRLTLLPAGSTPPFPTELLGSVGMRRTLDTLRVRFDRIVIDTPATTPLADVGTMAPLADGVVIVVRAGVTQRPALDEALESFGEQKVLGIVLNDVA
jgi:capsular exopolysaccharide synthesis family protein